MIRRLPSNANFSFFFPNNLLHCFLVGAPNVVTSRFPQLDYHYQRPGLQQRSIEKDDDDEIDNDCSIPSTTTMIQVRSVPFNFTNSTTNTSGRRRRSTTTPCGSLDVFVLWKSCRTAGPSQCRSGARTFSSTTSSGHGQHHDDDDDNNNDNTDDNKTLQQEIQDAHDRQDKVQVLPTTTGYGVFSRQSFRVGDLVLQARALETLPVQGTHTIQVGWTSHVYMDLPSRLLNHKCGKSTRRDDQDTPGTGSGGVPILEFKRVVVPIGTVPMTLWP
jgi:hypothetical protein